MPVHFSVGRLFPGLPQAPEPPGGAAVPASGTGASQPPGWPGDRLELPVTPQDAGLNRDGSSLRLHPRAKPTHTLTLDEIVAAPEQRRSELLRRFRDMLAGKAGAAERLDPAAAQLSLRDGPWRIEIDRNVVRVTAELPDGVCCALTIDATIPDQPRVELDPPSAERGAALALLLDAFQQFLCKPPHLTRAIDPRAGELFTLLLGPGGVMNPQDRQLLSAGQRFQNAKLIAWDFNGTVGDGRGAFRPDVRDVTDNLNRMGAASVITTTINPQPIEQLLAQANIHFNAFFGGREVRDYPKNKHYQELAKAYGLDADAVRAQMVVIGDSKTDIPSDLPGVLFVNNDDQTPAEVIQLLLHELDLQGDGDFAKGLERALGGRLAPGERRTVEIGPIQFAVEMRDGSNGDVPCLVPTLHDVRVHFGDDQLAALLATPPQPADLDRGARYELGFRYIECILPEERLAGLLRRLADIPEQKALVAAGQYRLAERRGLVTSARRMAGELLDEPNQLSMKRLLGLAEALADVGDAKVAADLVTFADRFDALNREAEASARASLATDHAQLSQLIARAQAATPAAGTVGGAAASGTTEAEYFRGDARALAKLFGRVAEAPVSTSDRARAELIEALGAFVEKPFAGLEDVFGEMAQHLGPSFDAADARLSALFRERAARADELTVPAAEATRLAPEIEQRWVEIRAALASLVA